MNDVVFSQAWQNPKVPIEKGVMHNVEIKAIIHSLTQALNTQV